jgi:integrase
LHLFALICIFRTQYTRNVPNLKPIIRSHVDLDGKCNIKIAVTHDHKTRYIKTPWYIEPQYIKNGQILSTHPAHASLNFALSRLLTQYNVIINDIGPDVLFMDINTLAGKLRKGEGSWTEFISYTNEMVREFQSAGHGSTGEPFESMTANIKAFILKDRLLFKEITVDFLTHFERFLITKKLATNTVASYLNCIARVFNHAIRHDAIRQELYPFKKFHIKQGKAQKRALDLEDLKKLLTCEVKDSRQGALDAFRLIFFLVGINIKDLLYLSPEALKKGRIGYRRFKTGGEFSIKVVPEAMKIIEKYRGKKYLLNFMDHARNHRSENYLINYHLGKIHPKLTTYVARFSWSTVARKIGISKDDIQLALGHNLKTVTDGYIDYDMLLERVDRANEMVIRAVLD